MDLLQSFKDFIIKENLFSRSDRLLLAVSGGVDSVVLCELCYQAGFDFSMAHANFRLRDAESDRDEQFVRELARRYNKVVYVKGFETEQYAAAQKQSIQSAARELRYTWFGEILEDWRNIAGSPQARGRGPAGRNYLLTAHHLDDNIETLLMNFFKGTGIAGLRAIEPLHGNIVRPLLFAQKAHLLQFAGDHALSWAEDSSNISDKYSRNYFRRQVIPLVEQIYPGALQNLANNINRFRDIEQIYRQSVAVQIKKLLEYKRNEVHIPALKLKKSAPLHTLVYEIIHEFGFSPQQVDAVVALLDSGSGKYIQSATHRILKDRNWLIITPCRTTDSLHILVESADREVPYEQGVLRLAQGPLSGAPAHILPALSEGAGGQKQQPPKGIQRPPKGIQRSPKGIQRSPKGKPGTRQETAWLDAEAIEFPLLLRRWKAGDYFYPLGLRKKKKLARFFIDQKLSLSDKEKVWVLEMNKKIVWIVGYRIDDRFSITPLTRQVLKIETGLA
jgi:tRNA(Ile)-lysidine synthase